jgi:YedE family putative selenium metabolism protein
MVILDFLRKKAWIIASGLALGIGAAWLVYWGNPANAGIAPTCFIRDTAGALGLHEHLGFQYIRPELIGLVLGSFMAAYGFREFKARGGSSTIVRFLLGGLIMVGALTFLG